MKSKLNQLIAIIVFTLFAATKSLAQAPQDNIVANTPFNVYHIFDADSLRGFDEAAARVSAMSEGFLGQEFKVRMFRLKRQYINDKYNLVKYTPQPSGPYQNGAKPSVVAQCVNEDFEASTAGQITSQTQITGWTVSRGSVNGNTSGTYWNSCNLLGCCPSNPVESQLFTASGGLIDPVIGSVYPIYSVFGGSMSAANAAAAAAANPQIGFPMGGSNFVRINSDQLGANAYSVERLQKTFSISAANALFQFAFISVFYPGHGCCDAGAFSIKLFNNSTQLPCPTFSASALSAQCSNTNNGISYLTAISGTPANVNNYTPIFNKWQIASMDLSPYIGSNITIDIVASDCTGGGHYGYVYFDAQCGPMVINGNGVNYAAGTGTVSVPTCGASGATITAPPGMGPYSWASNNVVVPPNLTIPAFTNQVLISNVSAVYTLYMNPPGSCVPITRLVRSNITAAPFMNISAVQAACGGNSAVISCTPAGSATVTPIISWVPTYSATNSNSTISTYTLPPLNFTTVVSVTIQDTSLCKYTTTINVNPAPPTPSFAFSNSGPTQSITCALPTVSLNAISGYNYNGGGLNYIWTGSSTPQFTAATAYLTIPGVYTVQGIDPVTLCYTIQTIPVYSFTNAPTGNLTPGSQQITCGNTNTVPITINITAPTQNAYSTVFNPLGGSVTVLGNVNSFVPNAVGVFTAVLTNSANGCSTSKTFTVDANQGFPTANLVSPQNFTLGCSSKSFALVQFTNSSATGTNQVPNGGPVSFTVLSNGAPVPSPNILSTASIYTISTAGIYTAVISDNGNGCKTLLPFTILDNKFGPDLDTLIVPQATLTCYTPSVLIKGATNTPSVVFNWKYSAGLVVSDTIGVRTSTNSAATLIGNYTLSMTDQNNLCITTTVVPMYQNIFKPTTIISNGGVPAFNCLVSQIELKNNSASNVPSSLGVGAAYAQSWFGPSPQPTIGASTSYNAEVPGTYTLTTVEIKNGCTSTGTMNLPDDRIYPELRLSPDSILDCGSQLSLSVAVTNTILSKKWEFNWTLPALENVVDKSRIIGTKNAAGLRVDSANVGLYVITVKDIESGCVVASQMSVRNGTFKAFVEPSVNAGFAPLQVSFSNQSKSYLGSTTNNNGITTIWNFGNGNSITTKSANISPSTVYNQPGTYTVNAYAKKGTCIDSVTKLIIKVNLPSRFEVPNVFTPNGDGINDFYFLRTASLNDINASIFDRWGRLVFKTEHSTTGNISWDGKTPEGKEAPDGTYFFVIKAEGNDGKSYEEKGTLSLFR